MSRHDPRLSQGDAPAEDATTADTGTREDAPTGEDAAPGEDATTGEDAATGEDAGTDAGTDAGVDSGAAERVNCRPDEVFCDIPPPVCEDGQVPSVEGGCYGPCVPIGDCPCASASDCPEPGRYTCHGFSMRCGPFV